MCGRCFPRLARQYSVQRPTAPDPEGTRPRGYPGGSDWVFGRRQFLGDPSEEDPPVPIPNTVVKLLSPDGTARASVWESRTSPGLIQRPSLRRRPFVFFLTLFPPILFAQSFRPVLYSNRV